jgi:uncharacterized protein (DUF2252 family)
MNANRLKVQSTYRAGPGTPWPSVKARMQAGKTLRGAVPRTAHGEWTSPPGRVDPLEILKHSDRGRLPELLPIRYGRMRQSPFSFFRGSAMLMAADLAKTPSTGILVQVCGDCHAANFGGYASPERRLLFDINDFDETLRAPWEYDIKRLATSVVLASRELGLGEKSCADAAVVVGRAYRERMRKYARMRALEVWYSHMAAEAFIEEAETHAAKKRWEKIEKDARQQTSEHIFPKVANVINGRTRIVDHPPLVYHSRSNDLMRKLITEMFHRYRQTLPDERRVILDRYQVVDVAWKVVGIGSVGTRCALALLMAGAHDPILLQIKEAHPSVLEPYVGKSRYQNHGERVVTGQRMLQSATDVFLGWTCDSQGCNYYFRQLRDMKMKIDLESITKPDWFEYVEICAWALARAHARAGDAGLIGGYLGKNDTCDSALAKFALAYADQTERDYESLLKAIRAGQFKVKAKAHAA